MEKIVIISGPTASGKTSLSIRLAHEINGEIISCDSMQIYKNMDIGTAKIKEEEKEGIPHHMIDIIDPDEEFSVNEFVDLVDDLIKKIISSKKTPILVGGTGFFIHSLIFGLSQLPSKDDNLRSQYEKIHKEKGESALYEILLKKWPERAEQLDKSDKKRIIRALEIYDLGAKDSFYNEKKKKYDFVMFYIDTPREILWNRIEKRVHMMIKQGLEQEVRDILKSTGFSKQAAKGIGYSEMIEYINGKKYIKIKDVAKDISIHTRQFSKRQRTFFKNKFKNMIFLENSDINMDKIKKYFHNSEGI
ncbi:MAG: tRNA (adenosine(37)-N6)-dimethylallyltransferase MiaA [Candidatus Muiribacterium halophilum]|uniref:tRNA dimethylallyltransferase n=1 Tax=Muiribacterium halophilum TaxID=2053465 RepID=A0A2N5ZCK7_MUIH1|nr:MAG: tRNA (adenosine(37)-N6)-dimethylallyltransferase MiaA [Candidatus Muirbacterium halophilum]